MLRKPTVRVASPLLLLALLVLPVLATAPTALAAPSLAVSPDSGPVGTRFTVRGEGFDPNIAILMGLFTDVNPPEVISASNIQVRASGSFDGEFNSAPLAPARYLVAAASSDGQTVLALTRFTITAAAPPPPPQGSVCFPQQTGKCISDRFLGYWLANGGLAQQGLPISDEFEEVNPTDGRTYPTQYFERARFEYHPENLGTPFVVLLGLLGREQLLAKYPGGNPGPTVPPGPGQECARFQQTGRTVCGPFLAYWRANGALTQQGLPLTEAFNEVNPTDGQTYLTQYFERARFEYHPENLGTPFVVLLGLLGREQLLAKYPGGNTNALFQDDFSNPDSGWSRGQDGEGVLEYTNGGYRIFIAPADLTRFVFRQADYTDLRVEVDATRIGGPDDNFMGVLCRAGDSDNFYFALIGSDGYYAIAKYRNRQLSVLARTSQPSSVIRGGGATNRIRFDCVGNTLTLYANGQQLAQARDSDFTSGGIGMIAISFDEPGVDILFDNLVVLRP